MNSSDIKTRLAACGTDLTTLSSAADLVNNTEPLSSTNPAVQALITQLDQTEQSERYTLISQGIDAVVTELNQLKTDMLASPPTVGPVAPVGGAVAGAVPVAPAPVGPAVPSSPATPSPTPVASPAMPPPIPPAAAAATPGTSSST